MSTQSNKSPDFIIIIGFIIQPFTLNSSFVQTAVFTVSDPHTHSHTHWEHHFLQGHGTTLWVSSAWTPLRPLRTSGCLLLVLYIFTVLRLTHFFSFFFSGQYKRWRTCVSLCKHIPQLSVLHKHCTVDSTTFPHLVIFAWWNEENTQSTFHSWHFFFFPSAFVPT